MKLKAEEIKAKLEFIAENEGIELEDNWLNWVAGFAGGNLRMAESELEKLIVATKANLVCV
jgi:DNA polymerase III gamma/tau subunit